MPSKIISHSLLYAIPSFVQIQLVKACSSFIILLADYVRHYNSSLAFLDNVCTISVTFMVEEALSSIPISSGRKVHMITLVQMKLLCLFSHIKNNSTRCFNFKKTGFYWSFPTLPIQV